MTVRRLLPMLLGALACFASPVGAQEPSPARGLSVLQMQGCIACHSLDGKPSAGPSLHGRFGRPTRVVIDGVETEVPFDAHYVRRSLEDPSEALAVGYAPGVMPRFVLSDKQLAEVTHAIAKLSPETAPSTPRPIPYATLVAFLACAVLMHLALWHTRLRAMLTRTFGRPGHGAVYVVVQLASLVPLAWLLWTHFGAGH